MSSPSTPPNDPPPDDLVEKVQKRLHEELDKPKPPKR